MYKFFVLLSILFFIGCSENSTNKINSTSLDNKYKETKVEHNGIVYKTVKSPYTGRVWLDRNLGAKRACKTSKDEDCFGDYYTMG